VRVESGGNIPTNSYFYQAMPTDEYYHLRRHGYLPKVPIGHQGFAPNRTYGYPKGDSTHLVEFFFPPLFRETPYARDGKRDRVRVAAWPGRLWAQIKISGSQMTRMPLNSIRKLRRSQNKECREALMTSTERLSGQTWLNGLW
jgi:hypothetical protein